MLQSGPAGPHRLDDVIGAGRLQLRRDAFTDCLPFLWEGASSSGWRDAAFLEYDFRDVETGTA